MTIKKLLLSALIGTSVLTTSLVMAEQLPTKGNASIQVIKHPNYQRSSRLLTAQENRELDVIMKDFREQMLPLIKEKVALKLRLRGKMATPQTQWLDISKLIEQINENNSKITALIARTQLTTFQKFGVLIPLPHHYHFKEKFNRSKA